MKQKDIKEIVKEKYGQIALQSDAQPGCCGQTAGCCEVDYTVFSENYEKLEGYTADADLGLGCGLPTEFAALKPGHHVLDLGSGAGNDCFVARAIVGQQGKVTGLDFSEQMLAKARANAQKLGFDNVSFVAGDIEQMPFEKELFDVIISNCVLNLVPDKQQAFAEMMRVLKPGGHFCVSDVVIKGQLPDKLRQDAEMYAGCVSGASPLDEYLAVVANAGFSEVAIHKQRRVDLPDDILRQYLDDREMQDFASGNTGIFSITVSAKK